MAAESQKLTSKEYRVILTICVLCDVLLYTSSSPQMATTDGSRYTTHTPPAGPPMLLTLSQSSTARRIHSHHFSFTLTNITISTNIVKLRLLLKTTEKGVQHQTAEVQVGSSFGGSIYNRRNWQVPITTLTNHLEIQMSIS